MSALRIRWGASSGASSVRLRWGPERGAAAFRLRWAQSGAAGALRLRWGPERGSTAYRLCWGQASAPLNLTWGLEAAAGAPVEFVYAGALPLGLGLGSAVAVSPTFGYAGTLGLALGLASASASGGATYSYSGTLGLGLGLSARTTTGSAAEYAALVPAAASLPNSIRLVKLRADYLEFAVYQPINPNGIDWARLYFANRLNVGNSGCARLIRATMAKLYASTTSAFVSANFLTGTQAQAPGVTRLHGDATARVGTWTAGATIGPVSGVRYSTIIGNYVEYSVTGADFITLRTYQNNANGGTFDVYVSTGGVEIAAGNYCPAGKQISVRTDSGWSFAPVAKGLNPASTYTVRLTLAANTPASSRGYDAGLFGYVTDSTALGAIGTTSEQALTAALINTTRMMSPGSILRYAMPDCTKVQLRYVTNPTSGYLTARVRNAAGVEQASITLDAYTAASVDSKVTVAEGLPKDDYILEIVSGNVKHASSTDYRQYIVGGIAVDTTLAGDPATGVFDDLGAVPSATSPEPITIQGSGNVEYAILARRPTDANGVNEDFITGTHGHEGAPTGLVVEVDGAPIGYAAAAAGAVWNGSSVEWAYSTAAKFVSGETFASVLYENRVDRAGFAYDVTRTMSADAMVESEYALMVQAPKDIAVQEGSYGGGVRDAYFTPADHLVAANDDDATLLPHSVSDLIALPNQRGFVVAELLNRAEIETAMAGIGTASISLLQDRSDGITKAYTRTRSFSASGDVIPSGNVITMRRRMRFGQIEYTYAGSMQMGLGLAGFYSSDAESAFDWTGQIPVGLGLAAATAYAPAFAYAGAAGLGLGLQASTARYPTFTYAGAMGLALGVSASSSGGSSWNWAGALPMGLGLAATTSRYPTFTYAGTASAALGLTSTSRLGFGYSGAAALGLGISSTAAVYPTFSYLGTSAVGLGLAATYSLGLGFTYAGSSAIALGLSAAASYYPTFSALGTASIGLGLAATAKLGFAYAGTSSAALALTSVAKLGFAYAGASSLALGLSGVSKIGFAAVSTASLALGLSSVSKVGFAYAGSMGLGLGITATASGGIGQTIGTNTHMAFNVASTIIMPEVARVHAMGVRDQALWPTMEFSAGSYTRYSMAEGIIKLLDGTNDASQSCLVFGYGNDLYGSSRPLTTTNRNAYAAAAAALVNPTFGGDKLRYIQLWNEWNLEGGSPASGPGGTNANYEALFVPTSVAMQAAGLPKSKILTTGLARTGSKADFLTLMNDFISNTTILANAGALGVHLYNYADTATAADLLDTLDTIHGYVTAKTGNASFPIVVTEWGWPRTSGSSYDENQVSAWIYEFIAGVYARPWVKAAYYYQQRDYATADTTFESFGLGTSSGVERRRAEAFRDGVDRVPLAWPVYIVPISQVALGPNALVRL